jgi:hypothetical protein
MRDGSGDDDGDWVDDELVVIVAKEQSLVFVN